MRRNFTEEALELLSTYHPFLGEKFREAGQGLTSFSRYSLLLATTIICEAAEEDARISPGQGPLLDFIENELDV